VTNGAFANEEKGYIEHERKASLISLSIKRVLLFIIYFYKYSQTSIVVTQNSSSFRNLSQVVAECRLKVIHKAPIEAVCITFTLH